MKQKLKLVLALTQDSSARFVMMVKDYSKFFSNNQGAFIGRKHTYQPKDETVDDPSKRDYQKVVTTVDEKVDWFIDNSKDYIKNILTKEKTNALGLAKADLIVEGENWGEFTSNELLCLKGIIEKGEIAQMLANIPVRTETDNWKETSEQEYKGREIWEKPLVSQVVKTTVKEQYVLQDPNIEKLKSGSDYKPQIATKDTVIELGVQTRQEFSGAISHTERASMLKRLSSLKDAITVALEKANDCEVAETHLTAEKLFGYIFGK